jgi:N utilization substance protein B
MALRKSGGSPRSTARLAAVQALYQAEMTGVSGPAVIAEFVKHRLGQEIDGESYAPADQALFREVTEGTLAHLIEIDELLRGALTPDWPVERLESVLRAILRAATFELAKSIAVPARVVITEYVDIAHAFFGAKEPGLVNGVLDRLARAQRAAEWEHGATA